MMYLELKIVLDLKPFYIQEFLLYRDYYEFMLDSYCIQNSFLCEILIYL